MIIVERPLPRRAGSRATPTPTFAHPVTMLRLLRTVVGQLSRSARAIESTTGVTNAQLFLLRQLAAGERMSVNELATRVGARQNAVSPVLHRLITAGLVRKSTSSRDARRAELTLTPAGTRLLRRAPAPPTEVLLTALHSLSRVDQRALARGLASLVAALGLDPGAASLLFEPETRRTPRRGHAARC